MLSQFRLLINERIIIDSSNFISMLEGEVLKVKLKNEDTFPIKENNELIKLGGWLINVKSMIDCNASTDNVIHGWEKLNELIPVDKLFEPLFFSTIIDFIRYHGVQIGLGPAWLSLLRLCYWYHLNIGKSENFDYKQTEIKRALRRLVQKIEPTIDRGWDPFFKNISNLKIRVKSFANELMYAELSRNFGFPVTFHRKHDFIINGIPAEVKTLFSGVKITREEKEVPKIVVGGMIEEGEVDLKKEIEKFVTSKKVSDHIGTAIEQGGRILFIDATNTFFGSLFFSIASLQKIEMTFDEALKNAINIIQNNKTKRIPIIFSASAIGYNHKIKSFMIPLTIKV